MNKEVLETIAPCGLNCKKCLAYNDGDIRKHSNELKNLLGNFDNFAKRFVNFNPVFENYPAFKELLDHFTKGGCSGCRNGECVNKSCNVINCYKERNVDFCFECSDFPCDKSGFDENLKQRWIASNKRMKEVGVIQYWEENKNLPRYQ